MQFFSKLIDVYKRWPRWAQIATPVVLALLIIGALGGGSGSDHTGGDARQAALVATPTTEAIDVTTTTEATPTTTESTTTTAAPTTTTTAAPTTTIAPPTTTSAPPPPAPPTTVAPAPEPAPAPLASGGGDVYYANCDAARNAGAAPLHSGDPGYRAGLDRDHDGIACE